MEETLGLQPHITRQELKGSNCCRFCGYGANKEDSENGDFISIYEKSVLDSHDSEPVTLDVLINIYLPIRVSRQELYYPQVICSSCNYALDVTVEFFKKIAEGQKILSKIINEKIPEQVEQPSTEQNELKPPAMLFSKENPVLLAPKRRGRPRRDPNAIKPEKTVPALPTEYLELKPKRQSRRPARYDATLSDSFSCEIVIKEEPEEFPEVNENENDNLFPFLNQSNSLQGDKLEPVNVPTLSPGRNQIPQLKTDNNLLLGSIPAEFTSLTHSENLMDLSKLSVIMDGDEEIFASADPITSAINIMKDNKTHESVSLQDLCTTTLSQATKIPNNNTSQSLMTNDHDDSVVCLTVDNEVEHDSDASVRTIDFVVRKKIKRGRKKARKKTNKKLECNFCKKEFAHTSSLAYHRNSAHNNEKKFVCKICKKAFSHKQLLTNHAYVHSDEKGFKCQLCPAKFKSKASLYTHNKSIHTENSGYTCDQCGYQFNLKSSLKSHLRLHTGEKPYTCEFCHKQFSQKSNYSEHRRIHTGERPYKCTTANCDKAFTTASQLRNHKITHTGAKQYLCSICGRGFTHAENFKYHMRRHNGEKPIECPICMKPFTEPCSLKKHWRLHTGEKPYACDICHKLFSDPSNYAKHKKMHINEGHESTKAAELNVMNLDQDRIQAEHVVDLPVAEIETETETDKQCLIPTPIIEGPEQVVEGVPDFNGGEGYVHILNPDNLTTLDGETQEGQQVIYLCPDDLSGYYTITLAESQDCMEVNVLPNEESLGGSNCSIAFAAVNADIASQYFSLESVTDSSVTIPATGDNDGDDDTIASTSCNSATDEVCEDFHQETAVVTETEGTI